MPRRLGVILGAVLALFADAAWVHADTITLKNGKQLKGLVVEQHFDRILLSTEKGEIPILLSGIKDIHFEDQAQNLMQVGKAYETQGKLGVALAYYEKALEFNPELDEAKKASMSVRNRFWTAHAEVPRNEVEKQQMLFDSWSEGKSFDQVIKARTVDETQALRERLGLALEKRGDWARVAYADPMKDAAAAGLKKNDRLVAMDGDSLRYTNADAVRKGLLVPRYVNFNLEFERDCFLHVEKSARDLKDLGLDLKLEYRGLVIKSVEQGSLAEKAGLKTGDLLVQVNGDAIRYTPLNQVVRRIHDSTETPLVISIRRSILMTRK